MNGKGHQRGKDVICQGNRHAEQAAREAASSRDIPKVSILALMPVPKEIPQLLFPEKERRLIEIVAQKDEREKWLLLDGRQMSSEAIARELLKELRSSTYWGAQAPAETFLRTYGYLGI